MMRGQFNGDGTVEFYAVKKKPFDLTRLQAGMFMDRPDLWTKPRRNGHKRTPKEQIQLL